MRITALALALVVLASGAAAAQDWDEYRNLRDGFGINFPASRR